MNRGKIGLRMAVPAAFVIALAGFSGLVSGEKAGIWQPELEVLASGRTTSAVSGENAEGRQRKRAIKQRITNTCFL